VSSNPPSPLRILALETSGHAGSVALGQDGQVVAWRELPGDRRTARMLAPAIREVLAEAGWKPDDVTLVAVTTGPGSFTGLRLGVTTAKAFAYAVGAWIVGIDTREVLAAAIGPEAPRVYAVLDAQRGQLFAGAVVASPFGGPRRLIPGPMLWEEADLLAVLEPGDVVTGPLVPRIAARLPPGVLAAPPDLWTPQARLMLGFAGDEWLAGRGDDLFGLLPNYGRSSAAEEKRTGSSR
jgi:tRNA threonylcarbamoyladenosine biosynthesis protein TsaB